MNMRKVKITDIAREDSFSKIKDQWIGKVGIIIDVEDSFVDGYKEFTLFYENSHGKTSAYFVAAKFEKV